MRTLQLVVLGLVLLCSRAIAEDVYVYNDRGRRDPFVPLVGAKTQTLSPLTEVMTIEDIYLQGIAGDSKGERIAILNGEMLKKGDQVGRVTLKDIQETKIIVLIDNDEFELDIYQEGKVGR